MATAYYSIDSSLIDSDLTNFPVGVKIESSTGFMSGLGSTDWQNLHATVGGSECYVEVELWDDTNDEALLWVCVPTVSSSTNTVIKIETGTSNTSYVGETGDTAAQSVWDSDFALVYHMNQDPSGGSSCIIDSTSNNRTGTPGGSMTSGDLVDSGFGKAIEFDGSDDVIVTDSNIPALATLSAEIYCYNDGLSAGNNYLSLKGNSGFAYNDFILAGKVSSGYPTMATWIDGYSELNHSATAFSTFLYLCATFDASDTIRLYVDGSYSDSYTTSGGDISRSQPLAIGGYNIAAGGPSFVVSNFSEIRISQVVRSAAWIKATYHVLNGSILSYSATDPSGGTTEPDIANEGFGLSETIGANIEKTVGITAGLGFSGTIDGSQEGVTEEGLSDGLAIGEAIGRNVERVRGITAGIGFDDLISTTQKTDKPINAGLGMGVEIGFSKEVSRGISGGLGFGETIGGFNYSAWVRANLSRAVFRYYARITGGSDGLDDADLAGLKSFQFRMRSGDPSYLSLALVYSESLLSSISDRPNGQIIIDMAAIIDGVESLREELVRVDFYSCRHDKGSASRSITVVGYATQENAGARVELIGVTTETMLADGRMQYRCARPDFYLKPGDTAVYDGNAFTVGQITAIVSPTTQSMDVSEDG